MTIFRKWIYILWVLSLIESAHAQKLVRGEFFFDQDPGGGKGTAFAFPKGDTVSVKSLAFSMANKPVGSYVLGIRVRDSLGIWSKTFSTPIVVAGGVSRTGNVPLVRGEYFFDQDPGGGKGTAFAFPKGDTVSVKSLALSMANKPVGSYVLGIRVRDSLGIWSKTFSTPIVVAGGVSRTGNVPLVRGEYFFDQDPGGGKGTAFAFPKGDTVSVKSLALSMANKPVGSYVLGIRVRDSLGIWSKTFSTPIVVAGGVSRTGNVPLVRGEYFFDQDPGGGKGTSFSFPKGDTVSVKSLALSMANKPVGSYVLGIRVRDSLGIWSKTFSTPIVIAEINKVDDPKLVYAEYFFDRDPGPGKGIPISPKTKTDSLWTMQVTSALPDSLLIGKHYIGYRAKASNGLWTRNETIEFDICLGVPVSGPTTIGATICGGSGTGTLYASSKDAMGYVWYTDTWGGTPLKTSTSKTDSSYNVDLKADAIYYVAKTNGKCQSARTKVTATVIPALSMPSISNQTRCGAGRFTFVPKGAPQDGSYRWYQTDTSKVPFHTGLTYTTDSLLASRNYTVSIISNGGKCESTVKRTFSVVIKTCIDQTITFPAPKEMIFGFDTLQMLKASTSSGLKVKYELIGGPVRLQGDSVLPTSIGEVTIRATQSGNQDYNEAVKVTRKFRVVAGSSTLIIDYNQPLCTGSELKLIATAIKDGKYNWSGPNGFKSTTQSPSIYNVTYADSGNYLLTVYAPNDTFTTVQKVKVFPSPSKISLYSVQQAKCEKEYQLFTQGDSLTSYEWTFNAKKLLGFTDSTLKPSLSGGYSVLGFNKYGCSVGSIPVFVDVDPDSIPFLTRLRNPARLKAPMAAHYQWIVDNFFIVNSNVQELPLIYNGTYKVQLVNAKGCVSYSPEYEIFDDNLPSLRSEMVKNGKIELNEFSGLSIVPQPAQDFANITWSSPKRGLLTIELVNAAGQIASKTIASKENEVFMYRLATHDFTSGLYLLRLTCEDKQITKQLLLSK